MSTKSTNFARVSTEINEQSDSECDIDINVEQIPDNGKSNMPKEKLAITLICIFFFLVTVAITLGVLFGIFGLHKTPNPNRPKSSIEKCDNLRCCKFKSLEIEAAEIDFDCTSLQIEECVSNDDVCDWNCDLSTPSFLNRNFLRFDPGIGAMNGDAGNEVNDDGIAAGEELSEYQVSSVEDYLRQSKMLSYSECGDVYEVDEDYTTANDRFNDITPSHLSKGPNEEQDARRRLIVTPPDGRVQSSVHDTVPYKSVGWLLADSGESTYACTATLISRRVVITAASCVYDRSVNSFMSNLKFFPDVTSWSDVSTMFNDATYFEGTAGIEVPPAYIANTDPYSMIFDNWALVRLSTADTGEGWIQIGYDTTLAAPLAVAGIGYPYDKELATRWVQTCSMYGLGSIYMISSDCDHYASENGEAMFGSQGIIYGIWNSYSSAYMVNYYARIDALKWYTICDFITAGEASLCIY